MLWNFLKAAANAVKAKKAKIKAKDEPLNIPIDTVEEVIDKIGKSDSFSVEFSYCTDCGEPAPDEEYMKVHHLRFHPQTLPAPPPPKAVIHEGEVIQSKPMPPAVEPVVVETAEGVSNELIAFLLLANILMTFALVLLTVL